MRGRVVVLTMLVGAVILPAAAQAKGVWPSAVRISGPGVSPGIHLSASNVGHRAIMKFAAQAGFFQGEAPNRTPATRPPGQLGPKYTIRYLVLRWQRRDVYVIQKLYISQDLYPYADGGVLTYLKPGQRLFSSDTLGGWYRGGAPLKQKLVGYGLPANGPAIQSSKTSWAWLIGGPMALLIASAIGLAATRRRKTARRRSRHARLRHEQALR